MAASLFAALRGLGSVDVRRVGEDGGLALVGAPGSQASVDVYFDADRGCDVAVLLTESGESTVLAAPLALDVEAALRGLGVYGGR